jgi:hypothetical protein
VTGLLPGDDEMDNLPGDEEADAESPGSDDDVLRLLTGAAALALVALITGIWILPSEHSIAAAMWLIPILGFAFGWARPSAWSLGGGAVGAAVPWFGLVSGDIAQYGLGGEGFIAALLFGSFWAAVYGVAWLVGWAIQRWMFGTHG